MGKFVGGVLLGVAVVVGLVVAYQAIQARRDRPKSPGTTQPVPTERGPETPPDGRAPTSRPAPPPPGVTPAGLLNRARAASSEHDRLAAYDRLVRLFPKSREAAMARAEAQETREALARTYRAAGDTHNLRNVLSAMLWKGLPDARETELKREITALNQALIFSRRKSPDGGIYAIKPRDAMEKIARRYKVTPDLLGRINGIKDLAKIRFGDTLKVVNGPFDLLVELRRYRLTVLLKGHFVKEYGIGVGKDESTPLGTLAVTDKLTNPMWYGPDGEVKAADDPENPLGERWIGITGRGAGHGYGIHGTIEPESIGTACSRGCIRMIEKDVEEVFDFVVPKHSRVTIVE